MKRWIVAVGLVLLGVSGVQAQMYAGVKGGLMYIDPDIPFDNATSLGILLGYSFDEIPISIEGEYTQTVSSGSGEVASYGDLDIYTLAVYGVFRSPGKVYFKGKLGLLYESLSIDGGTFPIAADAGGLSLGLGAGWRITERISTELEWTLVEQDIDFISLGVNVGF